VKKLFGLLLIVLIGIGFTACESTTETDEDPTTLYVQFVPSTSIDTAMMTKLITLEGLLEAELLQEGYDININISIGTSYASVIEAMASGQIHVAFLTAQQYAFTTLEYPGKVEVLLTSVRDAYKAQLDATNTIITDKATIIANANSAGYDGTTNSAVKVSSYYSMLLVRAEDYDQYDTEGVAALAGKNVGTQSATSGSGYTYPSFLLSQNNLHFVTGAANAANGEVQATQLANHQEAVIALLNEEVDAVFTFFDARYNTTGAYNGWQDANPGINIFEATKVVDLTTGIYNDTISGITSLSAGLKAAIQQAFQDVIATPDGLAALTVYNHKGYLVAVDSDYDGERAFYTFMHPEDEE
jgi:phosphate/phosphite/phosphonate ABC transporter binding protein